MLQKNFFKKYKDDSQFVSLISCWLEHQKGPCRNEGPEQQDSTKLHHPQSLHVTTLHVLSAKNSLWGSEAIRQDGGQGWAREFSRVSGSVFLFLSSSTDFLQTLWQDVRLDRTETCPSSVKVSLMNEEAAAFLTCYSSADCSLCQFYGISSFPPCFRRSAFFLLCKTLQQRHESILCYPTSR